ncbi:MAG: putative Ig domain-containing protein [Pirellulales bacterium]|nr:putative Ig domain-containing protein [Pirellulales bacterium]
MNHSQDIPITEVSGSMAGRLKRRHQSPWKSWLVWFTLIAAMIGSVIWFANLLTREPEPPAMQPIADRTIEELQELSLTAKIANQGTAEGPFRFQANGPAGIKIHSETGVLRWRPTEKQGPNRYSITIRVAPVDDDSLSGEQTFAVTVTEKNEPPRIDPIPDTAVIVGQSLRMQAKATDPDYPEANLLFSLGESCPDGATIDPKSGLLTWTPTDADAGKLLNFTVHVAESIPVEDGTKALRTETSFHVRVDAPPVVFAQTMEELEKRLRAAGMKFELLAGDSIGPFSGRLQRIRVGNQIVRAYEYPTSAEAKSDADQVAPDATTLFGVARTWDQPPHFYHSGQLIVQYDGAEDTLCNLLRGTLGEPFAVGAATVVEELQVGSDPTRLTRDWLKPVADLYDDRILFKPTSYPKLRQYFAELFEEEHETEIQAAYGASLDEMNQWFEKNQEIKEEFFLAIDPKHDDVVRALAIFRELKQAFPDRIVPYANLAIATAVTWDRPNHVYSYAGHQHRTKSTMPDGLLEMMDNVKYLLDTESVMQGRVQWLPWEFLVHVVNHRTPLVERQWALANYLPKRVMFGKCYHDVPYDTGMLESKSATARMNGKTYTLPNLKEFGGVCAMQADFASRVGKSLGVPAAYVGGESIYGEGHAWVMWIELKAVTRNSIAFSLESHGRYRGDKYYVGDLQDPHTGQKITDRDLELRLHIVGINTQSKRHAALVMQAYPDLCKRSEMNINDRLQFLSHVIQLCPGNEEAWVAVAQMAGEEEVQKKHAKQMVNVLNTMFQTFALFPDFTWKVFDGLVAYEKNLKKRIGLYERLVLLYEQAKRPDLACQARLVLSDYLLEDKRPIDAITGLAYTIKHFPDEGRFVPKMLDKLESICERVEGTDEQLVPFYASYLPMIPKKRGDSPSQFCAEMYQRAIARFKEHGALDAAAFYEAQLAEFREP